MTAQREQRDLAVYAIRVNGHLGPLLLSRLPCGTTVVAQKRSVLLTRGGCSDLVEITRKLAERGVEVDCIRQWPEIQPR